MSNDERPRIRILETAAELTGGDRAADYGSPVQNMLETGVLWAGYLRTRGINVALNGITGEDVANMMALVKMARSAATHKEDNYIDGAAYIAIAGECSAEARAGGDGSGPEHRSEETSVSIDSEELGGETGMDGWFGTPVVPGKVRQGQRPPSLSRQGSQPEG